ncbi:RimJ/RimL family protein N-acetyltransferase [Catenuloplanes nepalensis]|uniref:RimJ/RimL family protein N-acetyltransferase n=1 Tax=Catenuloplanes nepalensis TaxID=587533 RepID=A0ABT9N2A7_9ACTN|nr:GNAT family N-acetyltransferase [Catenuloplanes nepalensis]MDP9797801.1 RimJ/RimL family protein N-acetyltransferase [Catenuloplanes nepalensis]
MSPVPTVKLRPATDDDRDLVLRWRNHEVVRQASFTTHVIAPDEHAAWWSRVAADDSRHVLIACADDVPVGVVILNEAEPGTETGGGADWSFYLDVDGLEARRALLPTWIATEIATLDHAFGPAGYAELRGEALARNSAVVKLHERFGFTVTGEYQREVDGETETVLRYALTAAAYRKEGTA